MLNNTDNYIQSVEQDKLHITAYLNSLYTFIEDCSTPISIAVQGDWGSGKSSMMGMLQEKLEANPNYKCIWFNTWQFSQFDLSDELPYVFINTLCKKLESFSEPASISHITKVKNTVFSLTGHILKSAIDNQLGDGLVDGAKDIIKPTEILNKIEEITNLKDNFQSAIKQCLGDDLENNKLIIFIDDLDRLQPVRAIEFLEMMKLFLDCEGCVFVLAIDTSVVYQGLTAKYGNISPEKQKSFFDKLIQLPFQMPVAQYNFDEYLDDILPKDFYNKLLSDRDTFDIIRKLINLAADNNPRSLKRIGNSFKLLSAVIDNLELLTNTVNEEVNYYKDTLLFALICLQTKSPSDYNLFISHLSDSKVLNNFVSSHTGRDKYSNFTDIVNDPVSEKDKKQLNTECNSFNDIVRCLQHLVQDTVSTNLTNIERVNILRSITTLSQSTSITPNIENTNVVKPVTSTTQASTPIENKATVIYNFITDLFKQYEGTYFGKPEQNNFYTYYNVIIISNDLIKFETEFKFIIFYSSNYLEGTTTVKLELPDSQDDTFKYIIPNLDKLPNTKILSTINLKDAQFGEVTNSLKQLIINYNSKIKNITGSDLSDAILGYTQITSNTIEFNLDTEENKNQFKQFIVLLTQKIDEIRKIVPTDQALLEEALELCK